MLAVPGVLLSLLSSAVALRKGSRRTAASEEEASSVLDLFLLPEGRYEGGKCMDGTQAGYYYGPPSSGNSSLWVISLAGGGACDTKKRCKAWAAKNNHTKGGSTDWSATQLGTDQLSSNASKNPDFHDAHHIHVMYCTGDTHLGSVSNPTQEDHWGYYFDGHLNIKAIADHLRDTISGATSMQRVLFQGSSAGGRGVFGNCDFLQDVLGTSVSVMCNPSSGWYMPGNVQDGANPDSPPTLFEYWSVGRLSPERDTSGPYANYRHPDCVANAGEQGALCDSVHYMYKYIKAPVYVIEDIFDESKLMFGGANRGNLDLTTTIAQEYVAYFGNCMKTSMAQVENHPFGKRGDGMFLPACLDHPSPRSTSIAGFLKSQGLGDWFFGRSTVPRVLVDKCATEPPYLPCNSGCTRLPGEPDDEAECRAAFASVCGGTTSRACLNCAKNNGQALTGARCTESIVRALCA